MTYTLVKKKYCRDTPTSRWLHERTSYNDGYTYDDWDEKIIGSIPFFKGLGGIERTISSFEHESISPDRLERSVYALELTHELKVYQVAGVRYVLIDDLEHVEEVIADGYFTLEKAKERVLRLSSKDSDFDFFEVRLPFAEDDYEVVFDI